MQSKRSCMIGLAIIALVACTTGVSRINRDTVNQKKALLKTTAITGCVDGIATPAYVDYSRRRGDTRERSALVNELHSNPEVLSALGALMGPVCSCALAPIFARIDNSSTESELADIIQTMNSPEYRAQSMRGFEQRCAAEIVHMQQSVSDLTLNR